MTWLAMHAASKSRRFKVQSAFALLPKSEFRFDCFWKKSIEIRKVLLFGPFSRFGDYSYLDFSPRPSNEILVGCTKFFDFLHFTHKKSQQDGSGPASNLRRRPALHWQKQRSQLLLSKSSSLVETPAARLSTAVLSGSQRPGSNQCNGSLTGLKLRAEYCVFTNWKLNEKYCIDCYRI